MEKTEYFKPIQIRLTQEEYERWQKSGKSQREVFIVGLNKIEKDVHS